MGNRCQPTLTYMLCVSTFSTAYTHDHIWSTQKNLAQQSTMTGCWGTIPVIILPSLIPSQWQICSKGNIDMGWISALHNQTGVFGQCVYPRWMARSSAAYQVLWCISFQADNVRSMDVAAVWYLLMSNIKLSNSGF